MDRLIIPEIAENVINDICPKGGPLGKYPINLGTIQI